MNATVNQKVIIKKTELPGEIVEERMGKFKVEFYRKPNQKGGKRFDWFENNELKRVW